MREQLLHALGHFGRGLVGKGDGKNGVRRDAALLDQVGDAMSDDARFARSGAGQNQHRPIHGLNTLALLRIQFFKKMLQMAGLWNVRGVLL